MSPQRRQNPIWRLVEKGTSAVELADTTCTWMGTSGIGGLLWEAKPILIQEKISYDPWKVLLATTLLNKTNGKLAIPMFYNLIELFPTPDDLAKARFQDISAILPPLGLHKTCTKRIISMSQVYISDPPIPGHLRKSKVSVYAYGEKCLDASQKQYPPTSISHLPGTGAYALDCAGGDEWKAVVPSDKELNRYLKWKWAFEGKTRWYSGPCGPVDGDYLETLITELHGS